MELLSLFDMQDLAGAKAEAAAYCQVLAACTPETMVYPE